MSPFVSPGVVSFLGKMRHQLTCLSGMKIIPTTKKINSSAHISEYAYPKKFPIGSKNFSPI